MEEYAKMELLRTHAFVLWDLLDLTVRQVSNSIYILDNLELFIRVEKTWWIVYVAILDIDDCLPNPCMNNGECVDGTDSFTCSCAHGFIGDNCSTSKF